MKPRTIAEPYKIKMVESLRTTTREQRLAAIQEAGYNTFMLRSRDLFIDIGIDEVAIRHLSLTPAQVGKCFDFADINARRRNFSGSNRSVPYVSESCIHILSRLIRFLSRLSQPAQTCSQII